MARSAAEGIGNKSDKHGIVYVARESGTANHGRARIAKVFSAASPATDKRVVLLRHLFFRLRQRTHIHYQIAALNARGHTDRIAPANFANRRDIYRGPTVAANDILSILAIAFRAANTASIQSRSVSVRLLDDHEAQRLATHVNRKQMQVG